MIRTTTAAILAAMSLTAGAQTCKVNGHVTGMQGDSKAYIIAIGGGAVRDTIQQTGMKDGRFAFTLDKSHFNTAYEIGVGSNPAHVTFFVEEGTVSVEGDDKQFFFAKVSGTRANDEFNAYRQNVANSSQARDLEMTSKEMNTLGEEQKKARRNEIMKKYDAIMVKHISDLNTDGKSLAALFAYWQRMTLYNAAQIDSLLACFDSSMASTPYYKGLRKRAQTVRNTSLGAMAPDFTAITPDGNTIRLSDLRGKYVVLDFWASWCHPCRAEGKNLKAVYEQLQGKPFEILSVSSDKDENAWRKAMADDGMTWKQGLLKGDNLRKVYGLYGITGIPAIWVIDPSGKIIGPKLRGEKLKQFCLDLFADKAK